MNRRVLLGWVVGLALVALLLGYELRYVLVRPGMGPGEVEAVLGRPDFVDLIDDVPPGQGHGTFYYEGLLRPYLAVVWGPDRRVREVRAYTRWGRCGG